VFTTSTVTDQNQYANTDFTSGVQILQAIVQGHAYLNYECSSYLHPLFKGVDPYLHLLWCLVNVSAKSKNTGNTASLRLLPWTKTQPQKVAQLLCVVSWSRQVLPRGTYFHHHHPHLLKLTQVG